MSLGCGPQLRVGSLALGRRLQRVGGVLGLPLPGLDAVLAHGQRPVDPVQLVVQPAGVADRLALVVAPPQGGGAGAAVGAAQAVPPG